MNNTGSSGNAMELGGLTQYTNNTPLSPTIYKLVNRLIIHFFLKCKNFIDNKKLK